MLNYKSKERNLMRQMDYLQLKLIHNGDSFCLQQTQDHRYFHHNQHIRLAGGNPAYYNKEDEAGRKRTTRLWTKPTGEKLEDLTEEEYNAASREEKEKYHNRQYENYSKKEHGREAKRMRKNPNYTAPYVPSPSKYGIEYTKEQYEQMSDDEKRKYHNMMSVRYKKSGNKDLDNFHQKMRRRLYKRNLPTYYSPEDEENA